MCHGANSEWLKQWSNLFNLNSFYHLNPWLPSTAPSNWLYTVSKLNYENKGFAVIIIQRVHHQNRTWVLAIEVKLTCYAFYVHTYPFCRTCTINVPITLTVLLFHAHLHHLYHLRCWWLIGLHTVIKKRAWKPGYEIDVGYTYIQLYVTDPESECSLCDTMDIAGV